ncbi:MAG: long-chain fatty acid--CoA ligase [Desulfarculus sp.]|nr:long-chain fatty acid--CoA ligase [Desulfarculus sp.]
MNIAELLTSSAQRRPDHPALRTQGRTHTYAQINQDVDRLARGLQGAGLAPGDVCVLMMPNSLEWILAYYALAKLGAVVVPVNFLYRVGELGHIFKDSGAKAFIGHAGHLDQAAKVLAELPQIGLRIAAGGPAQGFRPFGGFLAEPGHFPTHASDDGDTFAIIYTSGTTGLPKGAMLTHANLASNARTLAAMRHNEEHYVVLGVLPLFHIYGQTSALNASFCLGITLRLWEHFQAEEIMAALEEEEAAVFIGVPTMYNRLAELGSQSPPQRRSLKYCISGGASLPVEILRRFQETFHATIYEGYGLTECSPVCVENPFGQPTKHGSIGKPIPGFSARVVDELDQDVEVDQVGELLIQGPGVMKGYLNQPQATAQTLKHGWLHTGDLARRDEDGYIYIVDRKKDMIIRGGYNVYPREIEEVLYQHPAVLEAAVLGVPHADLGEEVCAVVVPRPEAAVTPEELRAFVKDRVAPYKYPRLVRLVAELPKTTTGKILKRAISMG